MKETKFCPNCHKTKSADDFYKDPRNSGGLRAYCKKCHNQHDYGLKKRRKAIKEGKIVPVSKVPMKRSTQALESHIKDFLLLPDTETADIPVHVAGCPIPFKWGLKFETTHKGTKLLTTRTGKRTNRWDLSSTSHTEIAAFLWANRCKVEYDYSKPTMEK